MKQFNKIFFAICFLSTWAFAGFNKINLEIFSAMMTVLIGIVIIGQTIIDELKQNQ